MISKFRWENRVLIGKIMDVSAAILLFLSLFFPVGKRMLADIYVYYEFTSFAAIVLAILFFLMNAALARPRIMWGVLSVVLGTFVFYLCFRILNSEMVFGWTTPGFWIIFAAGTVAIFRGLQLSTWPGGYLYALRRALSAVVFCSWLYCVWYICSIGFQWPSQVFPSPHDLAKIVKVFTPILQQDLQVSFFGTLLKGWSVGTVVGAVIGSIAAILWKNRPNLESEPGTYKWAMWVIWAPVLILALPTKPELGAILTVFFVTCFAVAQSVMTAWMTGRSFALQNYLRSLGRRRSDGYMAEMLVLYVIPTLLRSMAKTLVIGALAVIFAEFFLRLNYGVGVRLYGESYLMRTDFAVMSAITLLIAVGVFRGFLTHLSAVYKEIVLGVKRP